MRVRIMDSDGDMSFGRGSADFYANQPEAVAQVAGTRLRLFQRDWFLDFNEGTPWRTRVLGRFTADTRDAVLLARLAGTPGVAEVTAYSSQLDRQPRAYAVQAVLRTAYGPAKVVSDAQSNVFSAQFSGEFAQRQQAGFQVQFAQP